MTIAIGLYIGKEAIETLLAAVHVLMEGAPWAYRSNRFVMPSRKFRE